LLSSRFEAFNANFGAPLPDVRQALFEKPPDSPLRRPKAAPARPKPVAELPQACTTCFQMNQDVMPVMPLVF